MRRSAVLASLLLSVSCAEQPTAVSMAPPNLDAAGKRFLPPPPGNAAVYFYNPTSVGPGIVVTVNGREIGRLGTQTWMRAEFTGGAHAIRCIVGGNHNAHEVRLAAGQMRFFDIQILPGQTYCTIREAAQQEGRAAVSRSGRAWQ